MSKALARQKVKAIRDSVESVEMEKAKAESELWDTTTKIQKVDEELRLEQDQAEAPDGDADGSSPLLPGTEQADETKKAVKLSKRQRHNL